MVTPLNLARKVTSTLRKLPGTHPLANLVRRNAYGLGEQTVSDFDGDIRLTVDLSEHMGSQIFWFGYYSRDELMCLNKLIRPGDTFIDGGANIGEVTLFAAKRVRPAGSVIAFEPDPRLYARCSHNIALNSFDHVTLEQVGLSDSSDRRPIFAGSERFQDGSSHDGLGTIYKHGTRDKEIGVINLTRLDDYTRERGITSVNGLKLDIEGAELPALRGAVETLDRFRPWLLIEIGRETCVAAGYEGADIFRFLEPLGYRFLRVGRKGVMVPVRAEELGFWQNVLCLPGHL